MTVKTSPSSNSNIFLFFGDDDFSLNRKIERWKQEFAKKYSPQSIVTVNGSEMGESDVIKTLQTHFSPSLFASKKLILVKDALPTRATQTLLADFLLENLDAVSKDFFVVFWQSQRLDGRLGFTKKFTAKVTPTEFAIPHGQVLNQWIKAMATSLGVSITDRAIDKLAVYLGRDLFEEKKAGGRVIERKEAFDLWQVYSELLKLSSHGSNIDVADVEALVKPKIPDSVFALTDQMVARNKAGSMQALENFLANQTVDEKTSLIKITALLSEQLRSLLVVGVLAEQGLDNDAIAEKLGFTSGRVFITSRNLKNISVNKIKQLLADLLVMDVRLKSSDTNQKLDLALFLTKAAI